MRYVNNSSFVSGETKQVKLYFHVYRMDDGSGGVTLAEINQVFNDLNTTYSSNNTDIQFFYFPCEVIFINSSSMVHSTDQCVFWDSENKHNDGINIHVRGDAGHYRAVANDAPGNEILIGGSEDDRENPFFIPSTFAHELGHCLGLFHTHFGICEALSDPCTQIITTSTELDNDYCNDTPPDPGLLFYVDLDCNYTWNPICDVGGMDPATNNIMSWARSSCRTEFTGDQVIRMHEFVLPEVVHTNTSEPNACNCLTDDNRVITGTTSYIVDELIDGDVVIDGGTLTINSAITFTRNHGIEIINGGSLILDGAALTSCNYQWDGIDLINGKINTFNSAEISEAKTAINISSGAIISSGSELKSMTITNCDLGISIDEFTNVGTLNDINTVAFTDCKVGMQIKNSENVKLTNQCQFLGDYQFGVTVESSLNISITNQCLFSGNYSHGVHISNRSQVTIDNCKLEDGYYGIYCENTYNTKVLNQCEILNHSRGIVLMNATMICDDALLDNLSENIFIANTLASPIGSQITHCSLLNAQNSILVHGYFPTVSNKLIIEGNAFNGGTKHINFIGETYFEIERNTFDNGSMGSSVNATGNNTNITRFNNFSDLTVGIYFYLDNSNATFLYNCFDNISNTNTINAGFLAQEIGNQGVSASNCFDKSMGFYDFLYFLPGGSTFNFPFSYYTPMTSSSSPTCMFPADLALIYKKPANTNLDIDCANMTKIAPPSDPKLGDKCYQPVDFSDAINSLMSLAQIIDSLKCQVTVIDSFYERNIRNQMHCIEYTLRMANEFMTLENKSLNDLKLALQGEDNFEVNRFIISLFLNKVSSESSLLELAEVEGLINNTITCIIEEQEYMEVQKVNLAILKETIYNDSLALVLASSLASRDHPLQAYGRGLFFYLTDSIYPDYDLELPLPPSSPLISSSDEKITKENLIIFPNPFIDEINLHFSEYQSFKLKILNKLGVEVFKESLSAKECIIRTDSLKKGVYFIEIIGSKSTEIKKIIKN